MNQNKKFMWAVVLLALLLTVAVSGTLAYLIDVTDEVVNTFTPSKVTCEVIEDEFDGVIKSGVAVKNTGNTDAFIRAAIVVTWKNGENGQVYGAAPKEGTDYNIDLDTTKWFKKTHNGATFYYWPDVVEVNEKTGILIKECRPVVAAPADDYALNVEILAQAIQAEGVSFGEPTGTVNQHPVEIAWGVVYDDDTKTIAAQ